MVTDLREIVWAIDPGADRLDDIVSRMRDLVPTLLPGVRVTFQTPDGRTITAGPVQPWTWQIAELFKVEKGKIHEIEALLHRVPYGMNSGWSTWSQGMSDVARDVTME